jgi:hypothetical protein
MFRFAVALLFASAMNSMAQTPAPALNGAASPTQNGAASPTQNAAVSPTQNGAASQVAIQVDLAKSLGAYRPIGDWFGYDESNYTTMKYGRQLLGELHDLAPAPVYIRAHHLFTSGDGVARLKWSSSNVFTLDANGKPVYDFTVLDQIFDVYHAAGVRPMVELGFMPEALATGAGPYYVPYPKTLDGSVQSPPKDYAMWGELVRRFTEHMVERYGRDEVATWYFEVWNEPDISYWKGTPADYFKLYDYSVAGVRKALPGAIVGGPAVTGPGSTRASSFLQKFFDHCANDKNAETGEAIPLDFVSFHPKGSGARADGPGKRTERSGQWVPHYGRVSEVPRSADYFVGGRSGGLRGLFGQGEPGQRVSQWDGVSRLHSGGDEGAGRPCSPVEGEPDRDGDVVVRVRGQGILRGLPHAGDEWRGQAGAQSLSHGWDVLRRSRCDDQLGGDSG